MADLSILLDYPGFGTREVQISPYSSVQSLEAFLPDPPPHSFYFGEFQLSPAFSLAFSGVCNNSVITIVPIVPENCGYNEKYEKRPGVMVADRLTDQFFEHIEGTTKSYRKVLNQFLRMGRRAGKRKIHAPTVIPEVAGHPATDELPSCW
jgi:hypothetical protein